MEIGRFAQCETWVSEGWTRVPGFPLTAGRPLYSELVDITLDITPKHRHLLRFRRFFLLLPATRVSQQLPLDSAAVAMDGTAAETAGQILDDLTDDALAVPTHEAILGEGVCMWRELLEGTRGPRPRLREALAAHFGPRLHGYRRQDIRLYGMYAILKVQNQLDPLGETILQKMTERHKHGASGPGTLTMNMDELLAKAFEEGTDWAERGECVECGVDLALESGYANSASLDRLDDYWVHRCRPSRAPLTRRRAQSQLPSSPSVQASQCALHLFPVQRARWS